MRARGSAASVRRSPAGSPGKTDAICLNIAHRKPVMAFRAAADRKPVVTQAWRRTMMSLPDVHFRQRLFAPAARPRACDMARGFLPCPGSAGSGRIAPPEPGTISSVRTLMLRHLQGQPRSSRGLAGKTLARLQPGTDVRADRSVEFARADAPLRMKPKGRGASVSRPFVARRSCLLDDGEQPREKRIVSRARSRRGAAPRLPLPSRRQRGFRVEVLVVQRFGHRLAGDAPLPDVEPGAQVRI